MRKALSNISMPNARERLETGNLRIDMMGKDLRVNDLQRTNEFEMGVFPFNTIACVVFVTPPQLTLTISIGQNYHAMAL